MSNIFIALGGLGRPTLAIAASVAALASSSAALAQVAASEANAKHYSLRVLDQQRTDAEGSRIKMLEQPEELISNWQISQKFSTCAVKFNAGRAQQFLGQGLNTYKGKRTELDDFLDRAKGCLPTRIQLDRDFLKATLSEELVTNEKTAPDAIPAPGDPAKVTSFIKSVKVPSMQKDDPFSMTQIAFECRVGFAPTAARALMATETGSDGEKGAIAALKAVTPQCDSLSAGVRALPAVFERAYASQALYHWINYAGQDG